MELTVPFPQGLVELKPCLHFDFFTNCSQALALLDQLPHLPLLFVAPTLCCEQVPLVLCNLMHECQEDGVHMIGLLEMLRHAFLNLLPPCLLLPRPMEYIHAMQSFINKWPQVCVLRSQFPIIRIPVRWVPEPEHS